MKRVLNIAVVVVGGMAGAGHAEADPVVAMRSPVRTSVYMRVFGAAQPPYGFVRFCDVTPDECAKKGGGEVGRYVATPERLSELDEVNRAVNHVIQPATDQEIYGVSEHWTLPLSKGDCEDYALLKRHVLMGRGWPASALLLTVVRDEKGEGHAVLTVRTSQGDYILDNKVEAVRPWNRTPYEFVMRQSYLNPRAWVSLDASDANIPVALAGVRQEH